MLSSLVSKIILPTKGSRGGSTLLRHLCRSNRSVSTALTSSSSILSSSQSASQHRGKMDPLEQFLKLHQLQRRCMTSTSSFDTLVKSTFPGSITNSTLVQSVSSTLSKKRNFTPSNTLLGTSFCADELARVLEDDFEAIYGNNFNLGGLSGFPFAGQTGFFAMSTHIPDDGCCLLVHAPHVGIAKDGTVGKVERSGMSLIDTCCGSAIAASNYVRSITHGGMDVTTGLRSFSDFQQSAVQELILPFGKRLSDAEESGGGEGGRMKELPYAIYDSQSTLVRHIIENGKGGIKKGGLALLGGIQINTGPETEDYFVPLMFDYYDGEGELVESMLDDIC